MVLWVLTGTAFFVNEIVFEDDWTTKSLRTCFRVRGLFVVQSYHHLFENRLGRHVNRRPGQRSRSHEPPPPRTKGSRRHTSHKQTRRLPRRSSRTHHRYGADGLSQRGYTYSIPAPTENPTPVAHRPASILRAPWSRTPQNSHRAWSQREQRRSRRYGRRHDVRRP